MGMQGLRNLASQHLDEREGRRSRAVTLSVAVLVIVGIWGVVAQPALGSPAGRSASTPSRRDPLRILAGIPQREERLGRSTAPVAIHLYGDLECPICADFMLSRTFARLISRDVRPGKVRIVYRSQCTATCSGPGRRVFLAQQAAAYAAGAQRRFWQYAVLFLKHQGPEETHYATREFLTRIAHEVPGLRFERWRQKSKQPELRREVRREGKAANRNAIDATPTLIFTGPNGVRRVTGAASFKQITTALHQVN